MADERTYGFNRDDATALVQGIANAESWYPEIKPGRRAVNRAAVIATDLTAPASSLAVATSCTIYFLDIQSNGTRVLNTTSDTAYNDDPDLTADTGTYCRVEKLDGRWMIYYLGCAAQDALIAEFP